MGYRDEKKSELVGVKVAPTVKRVLEVIAADDDRTLSYVVNRIIVESLEERFPELLATEEEAQGAAEVEEAPQETDWSGGETRRPVYDVRAAAGDGEFISEETLEGYIQITRRFAADLDVFAENLLGLRVKGDSMEPEICEGDVLLVDTHQHAPQPMREDVFVFRWGTDLWVKRLRPLDNGGAVALSNNPKYEPVDIPPDLPEGELQIIGRVVLKWEGLVQKLEDKGSDEGC